MKKILSFLIIATAFSFISCGDDDADTASLVDTNNYVRFLTSDAEASISENSNASVVLPLVMTNYSENDITITLDIGGNAAAFEMIHPTSNTLVIEAGSRQSYIEVKPIDNTVVNDPDNTAVITISSVDGTGVLPETFQGFTSKTITFVDDECPATFSKTYTAQVFAFDEEAPSYTATLTPVDGTDNQFTIDSSWGPNFVAWATGNSAHEGSFLYPGTLTINSDNSITIVGEDAWAAGGSGTYTTNPAGKLEFTVSQDGLFQNPFSVDVVLTGNCD